ncbi:MAG: hypothetical protein MK135_07215 [Polyangiaceae bacterium]|nr:hypothetical protein [Polyangiaceae bacterium]
MVSLTCSLNQSDESHGCLEFWSSRGAELERNLSTLIHPLRGTAICGEVPGCEEAQFHRLGCIRQLHEPNPALSEGTGRSLVRLWQFGW